MIDVLSLIYPKTCAFCRKKIPRQVSGAYICPECQDTLPWYTGAQGPDLFAPLYYRGAARSAIHRFKFKRAVSCAKTFGALMAQSVHGVTFDAVTWIPCSLPRRLKRGFDQCRLLALEVSKRLGLPLIPMLTRKRHGRAQFKQPDAKSRELNVQNAFAARGKAAARLAPGARILLVDDIYTTGATCAECRRVLLEAGCHSVRFVCIARK